MAENSDTNSAKSSANEGWFNSWLSAAKNKSTEVLEFVKKDLEEFGSAVKNEATSVVSSAGSVMEKTLSLESPDSTVNTVKRSFSTFLGQMNTVLNPGPDDEDTEILIVENSETHQLNKFQKALYELQKNTETYLCDPQPHLSQQYECWLDILEPDQLSDDRIGKHVNSSEVLKKHYAKLVPDILDHQLFWKRYLFKKALLEDEIARQEIQEKRDHQKEKEQVIQEEMQEEGGDNLKWEHDFAANVELTEEEQIALLEQYEREQKKRSLPAPAKKLPRSKAPKDDGTEDEPVESADEDKTGVITQEPSRAAAATKANKTNDDDVKRPPEASAAGGAKPNSMESAATSDGTPTSSSSCSTDDDWEKIGEVVDK